MKRTALSLLITLAALTLPASAMNYAAPAILEPVLPVPTISLQANNNISGCSSASNTIAVGVDMYPAGYRILCADAGEVGFWTNPVPSALVGVQSDQVSRFLCPSGHALAAVQFIEGLTIQFPLCAELIPEFHTGTVRNGGLVSVDNVVVEDAGGVVSCGTTQFVQSLHASRNTAGQLIGFTPNCNSVKTARIVENIDVDLAVRTVGQTATLNHDGSQIFGVHVFELGTAAVHPGNVSLEMRFDGLAWQLIPIGNVTCTNILGHSGVIDLIVVGKRCTLPGTVLQGKGGGQQVVFKIQPLGSDATRPVNGIARPVVSANVSIINENVDGADGNANNDHAAFPVTLR